MSEEHESSDPVVLLKKIQQHLVFLEKKIDTLISQQGNNAGGGSAPFRRERFSRPQRSFDHPHGGGRRDRQDRHDRPDRQDRPNRPFGGPPREGGQQGGQGGQGGGFFRKKKPFFKRHRG